jgi:threonylcarbamoyladenosine tRNA methylthiotransferase MtaB
MKKVALETVGCRLNQYETEKIASQLISQGMQRVSYKQKADLYILNSCTVTGRADADCRKLINRARRLNEKAVIVVTGCYTVSQPDQIAELNAVDMIIGNEDKMRLSEILRKEHPHLFTIQDPAGHLTTDAKDVAVSRNRPPAPNRALVKIGDGCDQCCSYCIVPRVRGHQVSRPSEEIIREIKQLIDEGYHEVVLTAVHIGKYNHDGRNLAGLVEMILDETHLSRLRLSSLEPNELDEALIDLVTNHPRVCRHLHLPLQSGSNRILKIMRRPYKSEEYLALIEKTKSANADITIGCDLIVGFPGETDDDFRESLAALDSGYIDYCHVFSYSDRPDTVASELPDKVHPNIIKDRNRQARELSESNRLRQMRSQIGKVFGVISEHDPQSNNGYHAVSDNYLKVHLPHTSGGSRKIIAFRPTRLVNDHLEGEVIPP